MKSEPISTRVRNAARRISNASPEPGRQRVIYWIQGFVAGSLFVTAVNLLGRFTLGLDKCKPDTATCVRALSVAWTTALLAAFIYGWIIASIDRHEREPWQMLLVAFLWGTVVSGTIAGVLNDIWKQHLVSTLLEQGIIATKFSIAPFTEELTKGAMLFLIARYFTQEFDGALDGIIYGAMVGIGFAFRENANYFYQKDFSLTIIDQILSHQFLLRVVLKGLAGHATYTALTGLGIGLGQQVRSRWLKIGLPILGLATAILAHMIWNKFNTETDGDIRSMVIQVALFNLPFFLLVIVAAALATRKEARMIEEQLSNELDPKDPYVSNTLMRTASGRRRTRRQTLRKRGLSDYWTLSSLQQAWIELAFRKWRAQNEDDLRQRILILRSRLKP